MVTMTKGPATHFVSITTIMEAHYNPDERSDQEVKDIQQLTVSIKKWGQLVPITVRWNEKKTKLIVVDGHRRTAACRLAGLKRCG